MAVAVIALDMFLTLVASGGAARQPSMERLIGVSRMARIVEEAEHQYREGIVGGDQYLCALLGASSARQGFVLKQLVAEADVKTRFLGLCDPGAGVYRLADYADPLLESGLQADLVVLAIHTFFLVDQQVIEAADQSTNPGDGLLAAMADRVGVHRNRGRVNRDASALLYSARSRIFRFFDVENDTRRDLGGEDVLWESMVKLRVDGQGRASPGVQPAHGFAELGFFDPGSYSESNAELRTLIELAERFRQRGAQVVIVLMPEHSELRGRVPAVSLQILNQSIEKSSPPGAVPIVDLRAAIEDSGFADVTHLSGSGSRQFSTLFANRLREWLPEGPPLMSRQAQ